MAPSFTTQKTVEEYGDQQTSWTAFVVDSKLSAGFVSLCSQTLRWGFKKTVKPLEKYTGRLVTFYDFAKFRKTKTAPDVLFYFKQKNKT